VSDPCDAQFYQGASHAVRTRFERRTTDFRRMYFKGAVSILTDQENSERTSGGFVGKLAGKAKEAAGSLLGNDDLAREGRLQEAQVEAEADAERSAGEAKQRADEAALKQEMDETELERQRLQNEVATREREHQIERDRQEAEREARAEGQRKQADAERHREVQESIAESAAQRAERERLDTAKEEIRLEQQAREAEASATADTKENQ
jgi:uncharacterized protein YjbJ (UPF0337 family)